MFPIPADEQARQKMWASLTNSDDSVAVVEQTAGDHDVSISDETASVVESWDT